MFLLIQPIGKCFLFSLREAPSPPVLVRLMADGSQACIPRPSPGPELGVEPFLLHLRGPQARSPAFHPHHSTLSAHVGFQQAYTSEVAQLQDQRKSPESVTDKSTV